MIHNIVEGHTILRRIIKQFSLCPKLCFMQTSHDKCEGITDGYCSGACEREEDPGKYNDRVLEAIASLQESPSFAIIDDGLNADERSCILVVKGKFYGMGYLPFELQITQPETVRELVTPYKANNYINNLVNSYAAKFPNRVTMFEAAAAQFSH